MARGVSRTVVALAAILAALVAVVSVDANDVPVAAGPDPQMMDPPEEVVASVDANEVPVTAVPDPQMMETPEEVVMSVDADDLPVEAVPDPQMMETPEDVVMSVDADGLPVASGPDPQTMETPEDVVMSVGEDEVPVQAGPDPPMNEAPEDMGPQDDFSIFADLLDLTSLEESLTNRSLTLFVPNNAAFVATIASLGLGFVEEKDAVATLSSVFESLNLSVADAAEMVLSYHVVDGAMMASDILAMTELETLLTGEVIMRGGDDMVANQLGDAATSVRDPEIIETDIEDGTFVIHAIDRVLLPGPIATALRLFVDEGAGVAPVASGSGCGECAEDEMCTATPWEKEAEALCLPTPPPCYLSGARNKGADNMPFVPYAPCCSGLESALAPLLGYGSWCLP